MSEGGFRVVILKGGKALVCSDVVFPLLRDAVLFWFPSSDNMK